MNSLEEMHVFLNGRQITLPESIIDDMEEKSACIPFDRTWLKDGENHIRIAFNSNLNGQTSGFTIADLAIFFVRPK